MEAHILAFDQSEFLGDPNRHGMNETGYLYLPASCAGGAACRIHVVFHGCRQTTADIGDLFVKQSGFNAWAESNDLILLYPQARATLMNPNGCWDWWGYDDSAYHIKEGRQMAAVKAMIDRLAGAESGDGYCQRHEGQNYGHWQADRAEICNVWLLCAKVSGESLGWMFGSATLYEHPRGHFTAEPCGG